jgi:hypothetical protein|tara:strand:- start:481 stop:747 length:267 start_codon:yes stop_codon:yes gene_type:complete|mmetsp:Transcript_2829/g.8687  ORF Transcript_2829/g.8687 Transcript_2829/m.8687 type:complete len:89 (+) Transcript_2829:1061-1327(+)
MPNNPANPIYKGIIDIWVEQNDATNTPVVANIVAKIHIVLGRILEINAGTTNDKDKVKKDVASENIADNGALPTFNDNSKGTKNNDQQ